MFSRAKPKRQPDNRYLLLEKLGEGGMGVVWKALDTKLNTHVAVKTLFEKFDKEAFDLFQKECKKLIALPHHPNIIRIMDLGEIEQDGKQNPYFVMPLLEGATLAELLRRGSIERSRLELLLSRKTALSEFLSGLDERLPTQLVIDIICQVCRGLQVAHENGVIHRDLKPSNIFVLPDFSVQIIDFGVARRTNGNSETFGRKGTLPYMSPEQVQCKPLTTASDIFSLGVVCYEALVGVRPFVGDNESEFAEAIVWGSPKAPHEIAPITLAISQAVFKALAKKSETRYLTAKAFSDHLQRALSLGNSELFPLPKPRLALAQKYHAEGNHEASLKLLETLHVEGISHPDISDLRERVDLSLRRKRIEEGIAAARSLLEVREYDQATSELNRVVQEDHTNPVALELLKEVDIRRTDEDVDELLRQGRRQLDGYEFDEARRTLERVRKRRPREPRLSMFSKELDRVQEEYEQLQQERQRLYDAVRTAFARRDISSARGHVGKLIELDNDYPNAPNPRAGELNSIRSQVEAEQQAIDSSLSEANRLIAARRLNEALEICLTQLAKYPTNEHFLHLQFEIEESQRDALAETIRETDVLLRAEPDLLQQEKLLNARIQEYPAESHFRQALERTKKLRGAVEEIAARARAFENDKAFQESLLEWQKLETIYPRYPGLKGEMERLALRRAEQERRKRKEKISQQIHKQMDVREFEGAMEVISQALSEFPGDQELLACEELARSEMNKIQDAQALLQRGSDLCADGSFEEGLPALRQAYKLDRLTPHITSGFIDALLLHAGMVERSDPEAAEKSLREAVGVDPEYRGAKSLLDSLIERRHDEIVGDAISQSLRLEREGDLAGALLAVESTSSEEINGKRISDARLTERQESLRKKLGDNGMVAVASASPDTQPTPEGIPTALPPGAVVLKDPSSWTEFQRTAEDDAPQTASDRGSAQEKGSRTAWKQLGRSRKWVIGVTAASMLPVVFFYFYVRRQPVVAELAIATAVVQSDTAQLLEEPRSSAGGRMTLRKGQRVNVLDRISPERPFVRVQFVSPEETSRPGFVDRGKLGEWFTNDIEFSWEVLKLQPAANASPNDRLRLAEALLEFSRRFPKTTQSDLASLQAARIFIETATRLRDQGKPVSDWATYLERAGVAIANLSQPESTQAAQLRESIKNLRQQQMELASQNLPTAIATGTVPSSPILSASDKRANAVYAKAVILFNDPDADPEAIEELLNEVLRLNPHHDTALRLKEQLKNSRNIFK